MVDASAEHQADIGFSQATFAWSKENTDGTITPSRQGFRFRIEDTVLFKKNVFNLIIGAPFLPHHLGLGVTVPRVVNTKRRRKADP